jgi:glycosyltransferase involved in cell wall biosynthesis
MKKVCIKGPFLTQSGYGHHARTVIRALRTREDLFDIYLHPITWGKTNWLWQDDEERRWIDLALEKTIAYNNKHSGNPIFDISIQVTIPNEWAKIARYNIGVTAGIETTKISPQWIEKSEIVDKILTISKHSKDVFVNTVYEATRNDTGEEVTFKCQKPVEYINYPVRKFDSVELDLNLTTDFNFLAVAQISPRKNIEQLIKCFIEKFQDEENVGLVIKANMAKNSLIDRINSANIIKQSVLQYGEKKCKIYLLHGFLNDNEMASLYTHPKIKAMVSTTHGEGFGLPLFESAYYGLPVIATDWSGHLDFLYKPTKQKNGKIKNKHLFSKISYTLGPVQKSAVWDGVLEKESMWAYPEEGSIKMNLGELYKDHGRFKKRAKELQKWVCEEFTEEKIYKQYVKYIFGNDYTDINIQDLPKISLITSVYKASEYIEQLMENTTNQTVFKDKCEWIILNANESGDDFEEEVILKYKEKYPENIVYKRLKEDPGVYAVWNMGIKMSTGEFITNINCDDRRALHGIERQASVLSTKPDVDLVYNDSYVVKEPNITFENITSGSPQYNHEQFSKEAMLRANLPHNNPMWRKSLHDKHGYFNEKHGSVSDWELWLKCAFEDSKFMKIDSVLGVYYFNPTGISTNPENDSWKKKEEYEVFKKYQKIFLKQQEENL